MVLIDYRVFYPCSLLLAAGSIQIRVRGAQHAAAAFPPAERAGAELRRKKRYRGNASRQRMEFLPMAPLRRERCAAICCRQDIKWCGNHG